MKHFYEILKEHRIDPEKEFGRLLSYFYNGFPDFGYEPIMTIINNHFMSIPISIRGSNMSLNTLMDDLSIKYDYSQEFDEDYFVIFCEMAINLIHPIYDSLNIYDKNACTEFRNQIKNVLQKMNYIANQKDRMIFIIKKNSLLESVVGDLEDNDLAFDLIKYQHHSLKGNVSEKEAILQKMYKYIENDRRELEKFNNIVDLFAHMTNSLSRHNSEKANDVLKDFNREELLDSVYQIGLFVLSIKDNYSIYMKIKDLKGRI